MLKPLALALKLGLSAPALAHSPVLDIAPKPASAPSVIDTPEHSKAIFAELSGSPDVYQITSDRPFDFYVGITQAKVDGCPRTRSFSFDVRDAAGKVIDRRDGSDFAWGEWYEEYGKAWYWVGPEIGKDFAATNVYPAGTYTIHVFNADNSGEYVLAVGDQERFGLATLLTISGTMKAVKAKFWGDCN